MSSPTLEPFRHNGTGQIRYKLGIEGASRQLIFNPAELEALRALIERTQEGSRVRAVT